MLRLTYVLIVLSFAFTAPVKSQTPPIQTTPTKPVDCACESQVLPETLAIVNGVKITSADIKKATGNSVGPLQAQVVEARKRELDLLINSKLLAIEAKKRGVSTVKLLEQEVLAKVKRPTQTEAQVFYDQNKTRINKEFTEVVDDIIGYLSEQRQQQEAKKFAD
ncbi:MAG TPA: hypothetical protein VN843_15940, partial [Anaerolineales bacterium]|nr:hypothetical protein [Anaerolineales bacterium]